MQNQSPFLKLVLANVLGTSLVAVGFYFYMDAKLSALPDKQEIQLLVEENLPKLPETTREPEVGRPRLPFE